MPWTAVVPNSGRSMTTSSSEGNRCTRISPSAVLDDRLDGKDLEWARDHLRRCEACRERVEDFREMLLRVGRLPSATVGSAAMDQAFALAIPDRLRTRRGMRSFEVAPAPPAPLVPTPHDLPPAIRPEVSSIPDLLTELEPAPIPVPAASNGIFDQEPALRIGDEGEGVAATPPRKPDTAMRIAVGLGAAACVLLGAVLYEGGLLKTPQKVSSTAATATQSIHSSATARASASPSASPAASASVSTSTAPVLYTLGNGVAGGTMFRIRPGTAVAGYTRLVFDIHGNGLPTMIITRPDDLQVAVTFKDTNVTGAPVNGISSYHVSAVEPGVQQGADGNITIDLARPVRVTAFTLPATGGYAWRLVVDLHTS